MKKIVVLVAALAAGGCGQDPPSYVADRPGASAEVSPSQAREQDAKTKIALITVNEAIQGFRLLERRYPNDLAELVRSGPLRSLPDLPEGLGYTYDAGEGKAGVANLSEDPLAITPVVAKREEAKVEAQPEPPGPIGMDEEIAKMLVAAEEELRASRADTEERMKAAEAEIRQLVEAAAAEAEEKMRAEAAEDAEDAEGAEAGDQDIE